MSEYTAWGDRSGTTAVVDGYPRRRAVPTRSRHRSLGDPSSRGERLRARVRRHTAGRSDRRRSVGVAGRGVAVPYWYRVAVAVGSGGGAAAVGAYLIVKNVIG